MIKASNLTHAMPLLDSVDIALEPGSVTGIIGPNGAGKTTLLKILAGLIQPGSGSVLLEDQPLAKLKPANRAMQIAYLEQYSFVHWPLSVRQLIELGRFSHRYNPRNTPALDQQVVNDVIERVGLGDLCDRTFSSLSGGERARVLIARALAVQAKLLLVDEPIASLDLKYQLEIMQLLVEQASQNTAVCVILHDLNLAAKFCDILYLLDQGKVIDQGVPANVLTENRINSVFQIDARVEYKNNRLEIHSLG